MRFDLSEVNPNKSGRLSCGQEDMPFMSDDKDLHQNWRDLCAAAAKEHDPEKLRELVRKINEALTPTIRGRIAQYRDALSPSEHDRNAGAFGVTDFIEF